MATGFQIYRAARLKLGLDILDESNFCFLISNSNCK